jgi:hypothetical protein
MQTITLQVPRLRRYVAGDRFSIYGNGGNEEVDLDAPALAGGVPFWPGATPHAGHLNESHLSFGHLDHVIQDGHLTGGHLRHEHLLPEAVLRYTTPPWYLGHYVIAVLTMDAAGNRSGDPPAEVRTTVNSSPHPAGDLAKAGTIAGTGQLAFTFTPSPDLAA